MPNTLKTLQRSSLSFTLIFTNQNFIYQNIKFSHNGLCCQILFNQQAFDSITHINLFFFLLRHFLIYLSITNIQLFTHIAKSFHLNCSFLSFQVCSFDGWFSDQRNGRQSKFVVCYQACYQDSSVSSELQISQMPYILKIFSNRGRAVSRRMIAQNSSKYQGSPFLGWAKLFFCSHIEHAYRFDQFMLDNQFSNTFSYQLALSLPGLIKFFDEYLQIQIILVSVASFILIYGLGIGDDQVAGGACQVFLHLQVLIETPLIQVLLHVLDDDLGRILNRC